MRRTPCGCSGVNTGESVVGEVRGGGLRRPSQDFDFYPGGDTKVGRGLEE